MATIHTAGITVEVPDDVATDILTHARNHAASGTVNTVSVRDGSTIAAFLVGAGVPLAIRTSDTSLRESLTTRGVDILSFEV